MSTTPRTPIPQSLGDPVPMTLPRLAEKKHLGEPIAMITAYDYPSAQVAQQAGVDVVLVGDSGAMTVLGYPSTVPVSTDEMLMLAAAVRRGLETPLLVGDLPFGSYEASDELAIATAQRFVKEAGCFSIVFEAIPAAVAAELTPRLEIPVIGIGAGPATDGQVLVLHDLLGMYSSSTGHAPRFAKRYAEIKSEMVAGVAAYVAEVRGRAFPGPEHTYSIDDDELERFRAVLA